jgi:hypothetical protein
MLGYGKLCVAVAVVGAKESIKEKIAKQEIAIAIEVHSIALSKFSLLPIGKRAQSAHHFKHIPHRRIVPLRQTQNCISSRECIDIRCPTASQVITVGNENDSRMRRSRFYNLQELLIFLFKLFGIEVFATRVIDANGKHNQVGVEQRKLFAKQRAVKV